MIPLITRRLALFLAILLMVCVISACDFEDPYVPDFAGSGTLTGRIVTHPAIELGRAEVFLSGQDSFAGITDENGSFHFQYITPGDYFLQVQRKPYLLDSFPMTILKSMNKDTGDLEVNLRGAIAGTIPRNKMGDVHGELELIVYVDGVPLILQKGSEGDLAIDILSDESNITINTTTIITVYIDDVPYSATIQDDGTFLVEFVPPGIYSDVRVKLNSGENGLPIASGSPIVVKSGQTRVLPSI